MKNEPTIYVVDDDQAVRDSLRWLLESVNHNVKTFSSANDFLTTYESDRPGCLLLDVRMPGMSGLELQGFLKKRNVKIPIIIITGHGDVPMAVRARRVLMTFLPNHLMIRNCWTVFNIVFRRTPDIGKSGKKMRYLKNVLGN